MANPGGTPRNLSKGRPKGSKNRRTIFGLKTLEAMKQPALDSLDYFLNHPDDSLRMEATKTVLRYILPTPTQAQRVEGGVRVEVVYVTRRTNDPDPT